MAYELVEAMIAMIVGPIKAFYADTTRERWRDTRRLELASEIANPLPRAFGHHRRD